MDGRVTRWDAGAVSEAHDQPDSRGPGPELHRRVDRIVSAVVVLSRITVLVMVALSVIAGVQTRAYTNAPLAAAVYLAVAGYAALLLTLVARGGGVPPRALAGDVAVTSAG